MHPSESRPWSLILLFVRQALTESSRGSSLGVLWLLFEPLAFIMIFTLVFSKVMSARLVGFDNPFAYSIYLVAGLLSWNLFSGTLIRLVDVYRSKGHYIRKVPMPLHVLPLFAPLTELIIFSIAFGLYFLFLLGIGHLPGAGWWVVPIALMVLLGFAAALGSLLGVLNVFLPDVKQTVMILLQFGFWMTPIVYTPDILPQWARPLLWLNLPYLAIEPIQQVLLRQQAPAPTAFLGLAVLALVAFLLWHAARRLLRRLERDIRDLV